MRPSVLSLAASALAGVALAQDDTRCADGLYLLVARGTNEDAGPGATGELAQRIADEIPGSIIEGLDYPATFTNPNYVDSQEDGVEAMTERLTDYHDQCPDGKIAVMGYSQGAQVSADVFCGGSVANFSQNAPFPKDVVEDNVIAIVLFGDPSHIANATFQEGTSTNDGIFPRTNVTVCDKYPSLVSYCDTGDVYCDRGDEGEVHGEYIQRYGDDVFDFVVARWNEASDESSGNGETTTTATTSAGPAQTSGSPTQTDDDGQAQETGDDGSAATRAGEGMGMAMVQLTALVVIWMML